MTDCMDQVKIDANGTIFVNGTLSKLRVVLNGQTGVRTLKWIDGERVLKLDVVTRIWHKPEKLARIVRHHLASIDA
jgi:hypothetical protein